MASIAAIESAAKDFSDARAALSAVCQGLQTEIEAVKARHLQKLRVAVATAKSKHATAAALVQQSPELFVRPRSYVFHGVKLGYQKEKGKLVIENEDKTVKLIKKHFADKADVLITTIEKPSKDALGQLTGDDLKKLGVVVTADGDVVFVKDTAAEVDKLVNAFLKDEAAPAENERKAA